MDETMKVQIADELNEQGRLWWYKDRKGDTFTVKRDPINPRTYFYIIKNRVKHQIRCCDCEIVK